MQCFVKIITIKVDQELEESSQLFTIMVNKCCRKRLPGNVTPEGISTQRFPMNHIMKFKMVKSYSPGKLGAKQEQCSITES